MSTVYEAQRFLQTTLSAALPIPVAELGTARGLQMPYCVWEVRPRPDVRSKSGLVWAPVEATVRVVGKGSPVPLNEYVEAAENVLQRNAGMDCRRMSGFRLPVYYMEGENTPTQEIGAVFRLRVREGSS